MTRNQKIERFLRYPNITYERIGQRFGLSRERVRQIRIELFMKGGTIKRTGSRLLKKRYPIQTNMRSL